MHRCAYTLPTLMHVTFCIVFFACSHERWLQSWDGRKSEGHRTTSFSAVKRCASGERVSVCRTHLQECQQGTVSFQATIQFVTHSNRSQASLMSHDTWPVADSHEQSLCCRLHLCMHTARSYSSSSIYHQGWCSVSTHTLTSCTR